MLPKESVTAWFVLDVPSASLSPYMPRNTRYRVSLSELPVMVVSLSVLTRMPSYPRQSFHVCVLGSVDTAASVESA